MTSANHELVRDFFAALSSGSLPSEMLCPDMTAWTTTSGVMDKMKFQGGVKLLGAIFGGSLRYSIDSLTAEDDRVAAEVQSCGTLIDGKDFNNVHVFVFRIHDGRIAEVAEHMNPFIVREKLVPLMQAALAKSSG